MCGRFTLRASPRVIAGQFDLFETPEFTARYNIAPSQAVAAVRTRGEALPPGRELVFLRWGLIPAWADDPSIGNRLINARAETVAQKPTFRHAFARRRCLIVADGFYEWQGRGRGKQPYLIQLRDGGPFAFAGLWEAWEGAGHAYVESCTILTTEANALVRPLHDRMPVIVAPADYGLWLDPQLQDAARLTELLRPFASDALEAFRVSSRVNSPTHEGPECVAPAEGQRGLGFDRS
jgi:putative SOS response-associated peptidase YedK